MKQIGIVVFALTIILMGSGDVFAATITVSGGGTDVISTAVASAGAGDTIEITDSAIYVQSVQIDGQWKVNMTLQAAAGQAPEINFTQSVAVASIAPVVDGVQIGNNGGGQITMRTSTAGFYSVGTQNLSNGETLRVENVRFTGADGGGRNTWLGGAAITNGTNTLEMDNCFFDDMADDAPGRYTIFPNPWTHNAPQLTHITNSDFIQSVSGGSHIFINMTNAGQDNGLVPICRLEECYFKYAYHQIDCYQGTLEVRKCVFVEPWDFSIQIYPYEPVVTIEESAFWRLAPGNIFIWIPAALKSPVVTVDHCDFSGEPNYWDGPAVQVGNVTNATVSVTNSSIGLTQSLADSTSGPSVSGFYDYNNFFRFPKNVANDGTTWVSGGHDVTPEDPAYLSPPDNWTYTSATLLVADDLGGPLGSQIDTSLFVVEEWIQY